jgi:uncharacterized Fe-S cluster-containing radical SAM superfamily enzyme
MVSVIILNVRIIHGCNESVIFYSVSFGPFSILRIELHMVTCFCSSYS